MRRTQDDSHSAATTCIREGLLVEPSPAFAALLGQTAESLEGTEFLQQVHAQDRDELKATLELIKAERAVVQFEKRFAWPPSGGYRTLFCTAWWDVASRTIRLAAIDLADAEIVHHLLRESESRYLQLLDAVTTYTYTVIFKDGHPAGTVHGEGCLSATGYTQEEFEARPYLWIEIVHAEDREMVRDHVERILRGESLPALEHRINHKDGSVRWVRDTTVIHRSPSGELERYDGLVEDITDRKKLQERFRRLLESAPDAMIVVDQQGAIVLANARAESLFGYSRQELLGQKIELLVPEAARRGHDSLRRSYTGRPHTRPMSQVPGLRARRKDGVELPVEISLSPIDTDEGLLVAASVRDLTEKHSLQRAVETNLLIQSTISRILQTSLEAISLDDHLSRTLELILSVPWFADQAMGGIFLAAESGDELLLKVHRGLPPEVAVQCARIAPGTCLCGTAALHRQIIHKKSVDDDHVLHYPGMPPHGHYCVPILADQHLFGVITLFLRSSDHGNEAEVQEFLASVSRVLAGTIERKHAEEALKESRERFDLAVLGSNAGIWDWDLRTNRVYFSPRWKGLIGYEDHEIQSAFFEWQNRLHPEDRDRAAQVIKNYLEGRSTEYELEHRLQHKDGSYRWILARGAAVRDDQGHPYRMVGWHIDVTDHKQTVDRLNENLIQLNAAQRIQQSLLPTQAPNITGLDIAGASYPATYTGGDLFDYLPMLGGSLGILIGDVSGHGLPAALLMTSTQAFLRCLAQTCTTVGEILTRVNRFVHGETDFEHFVTLLLMQYNPRTRQLLFTNAGHPSGYVFDVKGEIKQQLESTSIPLGIREHVDFPVREPITLETGDLVALITDGILEAESPSGKQYGEQRTINMIRSLRDRSSQEILHALHADIVQFTGKEIPADDLTAVIIRVER